MKHDYHFVLPKSMKNKIISFSKILNTSISSTIIYILKVTYSISKKYYYLNCEDLNFSYKYIDANDDIHVYMNNDDYRKIRKIHEDMFVYSMAILVRGMIKIFFSKIEKYGFEKFLKIMERYDRIVDNKFSKTRSWKKHEAYKHMSYLFLNEEYYKFTYSKNFTLLGIELLKPYVFYC